MIRRDPLREGPSRILVDRPRPDRYRIRRRNFAERRSVRVGDDPRRNVGNILS